MYTDKFGIEVACLRSGSFRPHPENLRQRSTWLSPDDAVHLVARCLAADPLGSAVIYGVSDNRRRWWHIDDAVLVGYAPRDDAGKHMADFAAETFEGLRGGVFADHDYQGGAG
jgi:uronate dehydrogenase